MPIFGEAKSPYDEVVEKVTAETLTSENWALMMDICDRVSGEGTAGSKQCLLSVKKRLNHRDPHVVIFALSLLDCLWNNCGSTFRREVSSKEFISELNYKATNSNRVVGEKTRELIKKWVDSECKKDSSLSLIETLYKDLLESGYTFDTETEKKKTPKLPDDPNFVMTEEEEADIAKAIAMSLNEVKGKEKTKSTAYPSLSLTTSTKQSMKNVNKQVRALYDFEAAEDNELSFNVGDIITIVEDSDPNWWKGHSARGSGLIPASFVTSDLAPPPQEPEKELSQPQQPAEPPVQIDENVLRKCTELLEHIAQCDPTTQEPPELAYFEQASMAQAPLIDQKLALIDKQHNMLAQVDIAIRDVLASYDDAVQQVQYAMPINYPQPPGGYPGYSQQPTQSVSGAPLPPPQQPQQNDWQRANVSTAEQAQNVLPHSSPYDPTAANQSAATTNYIPQFN
jgi:signal transducing adaptor molecule